MQATTLHTKHFTLAFNGATYFVKLTDQAMAKWLPVQAINTNKETGLSSLQGVYGWNIGQRQALVNRKGQRVDTLSANNTRFNLADLEVNNRVKLYTSKVSTKVINNLPKQHTEALEMAKGFDTCQITIDLLIESKQEQSVIDTIKQLQRGHIA